MRESKQQISRFQMQAKNECREQLWKTRRNVRNIDDISQGKGMLSTLWQGGGGRKMSRTAYKMVRQGHHKSSLPVNRF
ncbi:hypothetical protein SERLA73DRAFT_184240 [Serpula lacrymans var. lacrymans S7.3]|uniref:Uncharacterized protein n=2 Tax=Serpula lacrymans var. lacrymans TaxID=341189 RepID=F8Q2U2_SERL3|nr:uncharacterized protein SERLADRAFT_471830 [Serpula lacrymans var. lacrymans S7.9]EGN97503.1 hypothetical protein SERLA73DRAFT_184240 [Serpula lacrymans var. lacrymans S7.3]EGO23104.1 hypothetical protein SERLADRAFT_471830 [Serpula lacrymans var. lacrymans S7.9]